LIQIRALFDCFVFANLTVNLLKCELAKATVTYLGKVVGQGQVRPVHAKVEAIDKYPSPTTKRELMRFLGMAGFYRCFCMRPCCKVFLPSLAKNNDVVLIYSAAPQPRYNSIHSGALRNLKLITL